MCIGFPGGAPPQGLRPVRTLNRTLIKLGLWAGGLQPALREHADPAARRLAPPLLVHQAGWATRHRLLRHPSPPRIGMPVSRSRRLACQWSCRAMHQATWRRGVRFLPALATAAAATAAAATAFAVLFY